MRRISQRLNGHFSFFDEDDLFQEAVEHLWVAYQRGSLDDKTDSYVLQGCYFYLKNYLRKNLDKASLISLNKLADDEETDMEERLASNDRSIRDLLDDGLLTETIGSECMTDKEKRIVSLSVKGLTTREIGRRLGISHVRVVKLKKRIRQRCYALKNTMQGRYQN